VERYDRKSLATMPDGQRVVVSTVRNPMTTETLVLPGDGEGQVTSLMPLVRVKHGVDSDLDAAHESLVLDVENGELDLIGF
jgi:hypothetical protein